MQAKEPRGQAWGLCSSLGTGLAEGLTRSAAGGAACTHSLLDQDGCRLRAGERPCR